MSLRDDLQDIDGVGEATADKILVVVEDYDTGTDGVDAGDVAQVLAMLERGSTGPARSRLEKLLSDGE